MAEYFDLDPLYSRLQRGLAQVVGERGLVARPSVRRTPMHINSGDGVVFISQTGEVFPSGFLPLSAGNVRRDSLVDIYRHAPIMQLLRDTSRLEGRCGRCEFAPVCGGSRCRAHAMTGNLLAEEPFCAYEPGSFPFPEDAAALMM
jgi:radical SAM protein with 4Fe4S-binding SPASM domain